MHTYGLLTPEMLAALAPIVKDRVVHDLGAGSGELAVTLKSLGAARVVAIDKERHPRPPAGVEFVVESIATAAAQRTMDLLFLSWPVNHRVPGLLQAVAKAETVIYLGKNTDGTACGDRTLWHHLIRRPVTLALTHFRNELHVYGAGTVERPLLLDELGALGGDIIGWHATRWAEKEAARKA